MKKAIMAMLAAGAVALCAHDVQAEIPMAYYSSLDGKCGAELKTAIHNLVSNNVTMLSYGSGNNKTWWGFYVTDYIMDGTQRQVVDRYSNEVRYFGSRGSSVSGMNIEHSFPKSWWGGASNNAYKDLYNLMPSEAKINSSKSNYGMGVVTNVTTDNGCTKVGDSGNGYKVWEPADKWKGDFARDYMYMATAYQDFTWEGQALNSLEQNTYPTFKKWAYELYLDWARNDAVNDMEIDRNQAVYEIQGNRNPYVDFPNLMEYVWGDSISVPLKIATTVKAGQTISGGDDPVVSTPEVVFDQNFKNNEGGCTTSGTAKVWAITEKYGWKGSAYFSNKCTASDASLETPEIDLTKYNKATAVFDHAANKFGNDKPEQYCTVEVRVDDAATTEAVAVPTWPAGTNWTFVSSGECDLTKFCGHKIKLVFHYTSTADVAGTWEIETLKVTGSKTSGIDNIVVEEAADADADQPVEYYSIDGRRLNPDAAHGLVIRRQGRKVSKVLLR